MIWFVAAACAGIAAYARGRGGGSWRFWTAISLSLIVLVLASWAPSRPSAVLLGLFLVPTLLMGLASVRRRVPPGVFAAFAASDICLAVAVSMHQLQTATWDLPSRGNWREGAVPAAVAALLRLGAPLFASDQDPDFWEGREGIAAGHRLRRIERWARSKLTLSSPPAPGPMPLDGSFASIGWWQGVALAAWAGSSAKLPLFVGALIIWLVAPAFDASNLSALAIGGAQVAIAAGLGTGRPGLIAIGLAAVAFSLGERRVSIWLLAILPFAVLTARPISFTPVVALAAFAFPLAWAAAVIHLTRLVPPSRAGGFMAILALIAAILESYAQALWLGYSVALGAVVVWLWSQGRDEPLLDSKPGPGPRAPRTHRAVVAVGWICTAVAFFVAGRLALAGLKTGFV